MTKCGEISHVIVFRAEPFEITGKNSHRDNFFKKLIPQLRELLIDRNECLTCNFHN